MSALLSVLSGVGFGLASALVPLVNAEAYVLVATAAKPWLLIPIAGALALGQTAGKLILFEAARRGVSRARPRHPVKECDEQRWSARIQASFTRRRTALPLMAVSAGLGLPPLALVSVCAGAAGQRRGTFAVICLAGRSARFLALALPAGIAVGHL